MTDRDLRGVPDVGTGCSDATVQWPMPADHVTRWAVAAGCAVLLGCNRRKRSATESAAKEAGKRGEAPPPFDARTGSFEAILPDDRGRIWVSVRGNEASFSGGQSAGPGTGLVKGTEAILHRNGEPSMKIAAPNVVADRRKRLVKATGRVRAWSLSAGRTAVIEADRMQWNDVTGELTGDGDVLLRQDSIARIPAQRFRSDARLTRVQLDFGPAPASGRL